MAEICKTYKEKYPLVQIVLHTATADTVYEMMNKGLVDRLITCWKDVAKLYPDWQLDIYGTGSLYHEQPPRVEYGLTELGTKMLPIVNSLADFGNYYKSLIEQN